VPNVLETAAQYELAKVQQLSDARELLAHPTENAFASDAHERHLVGAMYLAGYAVECALKEYLIGRYGVVAHGVTPVLGHTVRLDEVVNAVQTATGVNILPGLHNLHLLWQAADFAAPPAHVTASLGVCSPWRVGWRYQPPSPASVRKDAEEFVTAAEHLVSWIGSQP